MQLSSLIGKKIISPTGEQLGYVTGAYLSRDLKTLTAFTAADGDEEEFFLPIRAVRSTSDAIIAARQRIPSPNGVPAPIGAHAYSETGADLGVVGDWLFGDCEPVFIIVKDGVRTGYPAETVASGETVVAYLAGGRPAPKKHTKTISKESKTKKAATMSETAPQENPSVETETPVIGELPQGPAEENGEPPAEKPKPPMVQKEQTVFELGSRNLLGKRVVRSVFDAQGEIVALAGDRITPEVLSRARRKGRLLALTVNTLTNVY